VFACVISCIWKNRFLKVLTLFISLDKFCHLYHSFLIVFACVISCIWKNRFLKVLTLFISLDKFCHLYHSFLSVIYL
jgi:hypothetical protein